MKRIVQVPGIRRYYGDDFLDMQDAFFQMTEGVYGQYGDGVLKGCVWANNQITSGLLMYGGVVYDCPGFTGAQGPWLNLLANQQSIDANQYQSGVALPYLTENKSELANGTGANPPTSGVGFNVFTALRLLTDPRSEKYVSRYTPTNGIGTGIQTPRNIIAAYPNGVYVLDIPLATRVGLTNIPEVMDSLTANNYGTLEVKHSVIGGNESLTLTATINRPSSFTATSMMFSVNVPLASFQTTTAFDNDRWACTPSFIRSGKYPADIESRACSDIHRDVLSGVYIIDAALFDRIIGNAKFPGTISTGSLIIYKSSGVISGGSNIRQTLTMQVIVSNGGGSITRSYMMSIDSTSVDWGLSLGSSAIKGRWESMDAGMDIYNVTGRDLFDIVATQQPGTVGAYEGNNVIGAPDNRYYQFTISRYGNNINDAQVWAQVRTGTDYDDIYITYFVNNSYQPWIKVGQKAEMVQDHYCSGGNFTELFANQPNGTTMHYSGGSVTGLPSTNSCALTVTKYVDGSVGSARVYDESINAMYLNSYASGMWSGWTKVSTIDELNTKLDKTANAVGTTIMNISGWNLLEWFNMLEDSSNSDCVGGGVAEAPDTGNYFFKITKHDNGNGVITAVKYYGSSTNTMYTRTLQGGGTWSSWVRVGEQAVSLGIENISNQNLLTIFQNQPEGTTQTYVGNSVANAPTADWYSFTIKKKISTNTSSDDGSVLVQTHEDVDNQVVYTGYISNTAVTWQQLAPVRDWTDEGTRVEIESDGTTLRFQFRRTRTGMIQARYIVVSGGSSSGFFVYNSSTNPQLFRRFIGKSFVDAEGNTDAIPLIMKSLDSDSASALCFLDMNASAKSQGRRVIVAHAVSYVLAGKAANMVALQARAGNRGQEAERLLKPIQQPCRHL